MKNNSTFFNVLKNNNKKTPQDNITKQAELEPEAVCIPIAEFLAPPQGIDIEQSSIEIELHAQLVIRSGCYHGFYNAISQLENDYLDNQPSPNRLDEVRFIQSILVQLPKPKEVADNLSLMKLNFKNQFIEKCYHTLVGACLYIHQRIKDEYKGSWSAVIWKNSESSSKLFKILDAHLSLIQADVKQLSINQFKVNFILNEMGEHIAYPLVKITAKPETKEQFMSNIDKYMQALCPEVEASPLAI